MWMVRGDNRGAQVACDPCQTGSSALSAPSVGAAQDRNRKAMHHGQLLPSDVHNITSMPCILYLYYVILYYLYLYFFVFILTLVGNAIVV